MKKETKEKLRKCLTAVWAYILFTVVGAVSLGIVCFAVWGILKLMTNYGCEIFACLMLLLIIAGALTIPFVVGGLICSSVVDYFENHKDCLSSTWKRLTGWFRRKHDNTVQNT